MTPLDSIYQLRETLKVVEDAAFSRRVLHSSTAYTGSVKCDGILACYVTGPDDLVDQLKTALDKAIEEAFKEYGLVFESPA